MNTPLKGSGTEEYPYDGNAGTDISSLMYLVVKAANSGKSDFVYVDWAGKIYLIEFTRNGSKKIIHAKCDNAALVPRLEDAIRMQRKLPQWAKALLESIYTLI